MSGTQDAGHPARRIPDVRHAVPPEPSLVTTLLNHPRGRRPPDPGLTLLRRARAQISMINLLSSSVVSRTDLTPDGT